MARTKTWVRAVAEKILDDTTGWEFNSGVNWLLCNVRSPATTGDTVLRTIFDVQMSFVLPDIADTGGSFTDIHAMRPIAYSVTTFDGDLSTPSPTDSNDPQDLLTGTSWLYPQPYGAMADANRQQITFRPIETVDTRAMRTSKVANTQLSTRLYLDLGLAPVMWNQSGVPFSPSVIVSAYMRVLYETGTA